MVEIFSQKRGKNVKSCHENISSINQRSLEIEKFAYNLLIQRFYEKLVAIKYNSN